MTADAKVGLLLGLFFIVIIIFLVNGLPNFIDPENAALVSNTIITQTGPDMALNNSVAGTAHPLYINRSAGSRQPQPAPETRVPQPPSVSAQPIQTPAIPVQPQTPVIVQTNELIQQQRTPAPVRVRTHVVKSGEILPIIAKHYYGDEQGNRRIVIQKLYEANTAVLRSPDRVRVGDKLRIPPLEKLLDTASVVRASDPSTALLNRFPGALQRVSEDNARSVPEYVVRSGDSLWSIAQDRLGSGNRYAEIATLNKDRIGNSDNLREGMKLRLPLR